MICDRKYPELREFSGNAFLDRFVSLKAAHRYNILSARLFNSMRFLPLDDPITAEAKDLISAVRLLPTVTEVDTYVEEVVKELYANLPEMEKREDGNHAVYIRETMYEFNPQIINQLFQLENHLVALNVPLLSIPDPINEVVSFLSNGKARR